MIFRRTRVESNKLEDHCSALEKRGGGPERREIEYRC
jgi:hypothetical protein